MIAAVIRWSVRNRFLVLMATLFLVAAGIWSAKHASVDRSEEHTSELQSLV